MRIASALVVVFGLTSVGMASFELGLISDRAANVIHRMDTVTGAYLGSFGQNFLNAPGGVALDQANNTLYVADFNRLTKWNYNTGEYLGTISTGGGAAISLSRNAQDGSFNIATSGGVRRVGASGTVIQTYTNTGVGTYQCGVLANDGFYYVSRNDNSSNFRLEWQNPATGALVGGRTWAADRFIARGGNNFTNLYGVGATNYVEFGSLNAGPGNTGAFSLSGFVQQTGGAYGHNGLLYTIGRTSANPAVGGIRKVDTAAASAGAIYGTSFLVDPSGIAIVVAPEPGSLAALAFGAVWMLRRRK